MLMHPPFACAAASSAILFFALCRTEHRPDLIGCNTQKVQIPRPNVTRGMSMKEHQQ